MLDKLFTSLRLSKDSYLNAREGSEFEDRVEIYLRSSLGLTRIQKDQIPLTSWRLIKEHIGNKTGSTFLDLPSVELKKTFIHEPFGPQNFPDFIVFTEKKVVPIEIKFSKSRASKPMWNSNVPREAAFYIFGSYGTRDVTFFCGADVVNQDHRKALYGYFDEVRHTESQILKDIPALDKTNRGFTPYIRMAFDQKNHHDKVQTNWFIHPDRIKVEDLAVEKAKSL